MNNQLLFAMSPEMFPQPALHSEVAVELHQQDDDSTWRNLGTVFEGMVVTNPSLTDAEGVNILPDEDHPQPATGRFRSGHPIFFRLDRLEGFWQLVNVDTEEETKMKLRYNIRSLGATATNNP